MKGRIIMDFRNLFELKNEDYCKPVSTEFFFGGGIILNMKAIEIDIKHYKLRNMKEIEIDIKHY